MPLLLTTLALCAAQQPFLDQPPSQLDSRSAHTGAFATADNFTVSDPAGFDLGRITWWGSWAAAGAAVNDSFDLYLHQDTMSPFGDVPGTVVSSFLGVSPSVTATGLSFPSFAGPLAEHQLDYLLPTPFHLTPGTYWLEIVCTGSSGSGQEFVWEMAPQDMVNGAACMAWSLDTPGVTWFSCTPFGDTDMALQLDGGSGFQLSIQNLVAGSTMQLQLTGATPFASLLVGYSTTGAGPTQTAFGSVAMSPPIALLIALAADLNGDASWSTTVPPGAAGATLYAQAVDLSASALSNPLAEPVL